MEQPTPANPQRYLAMLLAVGLASLLAVWTYVRTQPMAFLESGYASRMAQRELLQSCDFGELAVFGDSMAEAAVVPAQTQIKALNLAFGAATPIELYYWVEEALRCDRLPRQVVMSLAGHQFEIISPFLWENNARRGFLDFGQLQDIEHEAAHLQDPSFHDFNSPDGLHGTARNLLYGLRFPTLFFNSLVAARVRGRLDANALRYTATLQARGHSEYGGDGPAALLGAGAGANSPGQAFRPLPVQDHYFRRTLALLAARGVRIIFVAMPRSIVGRPTQTHEQAFMAYLLALGRQQPMLSVVAPAKQAWPQAAFADGAHMRTPAAQVFSGLLGACVRQVADAPPAPGSLAACDLEPPADGRRR